FFFLACKPTQYCAKPCAAAEEARRLVRRQAQRIILGHVDAPDFFELKQLAFDHFLREIDENVEDAKIALFESHLKGLHVQPVARQDAAMVPPARICRRTPAPGRRAVDHIIVNQRRAMQQLDYGGQTYRTRTALPSVAV